MGLLVIEETSTRSRPVGLARRGCLPMEDRLDMATRRRLTNRFKDEYAKASKKEKKLILDRLVEVGMGRSTARRLSGESALFMVK